MLLEQFELFTMAAKLKLVMFWSTLQTTMEQQQLEFVKN